MERHIETLKSCIQQPSLKRHREENIKFLEIALNGLSLIDNELLRNKKVQ